MVARAFSATPKRVPSASNNIRSAVSWSFAGHHRFGLAAMTWRRDRLFERLNFICKSMRHMTEYCEELQERMSEHKPLCNI